MINVEISYLLVDVLLPVKCYNKKIGDLTQTKYTIMWPLEVKSPTTKKVSEIWTPAALIVLIVLLAF